CAARSASCVAMFRIVGRLVRSTFPSTMSRWTGDLDFAAPHPPDRRSRMPEEQHSVSKNRQPEPAFAYLVDGEKCTEWRPGVLDIKCVSGEGGVGTRYARGVRGPMGRRISADYEVTACEPNAHLEFQTVTGPARPHG